MIKNLKKYVLVASSLLLLAGCGEPEDDIFSHGLKGDGNENQNKPEVGSTITYRAQVWVEKDDLERYGGMNQFKQNLDVMFRSSTSFWNESTNKFNYYFRWAVGDGDDAVHVYDIEGENTKEKYNAVKNQSDGPFGTLNLENFDFVLFLALSCEKGEGGLSCGGGGRSGQSVVMGYFEKENNIFKGVWPIDGEYGNLGHEYGHVRGAQDLYQYMIPAEKNPISNVAYDYPKCNMGTGNKVWSDYCSAIFNHFAEKKQITTEMRMSTYPRQMLIRVTKDGVPAERATVNFWGSRATFRDIYNEAGNSPAFSRRTDNKGEFTVNDVYHMFMPDPNNTYQKLPPKSPVDEFPYSRWYCFVAEVELSNGQKKCVWLSDLDIVPEYLNGGQKEPYVFEIAF